jgi:hypothetical protein
MGQDPRPVADFSDRDTANAVRLVAGDARGHYESFFQRANHPRRPLAFWIRYTLCSPVGRPADAFAELWAIYFDGEASIITAVKERRPLTECELLQGRLGIRVGPSSLEDGSLRGAARTDTHRIGWVLDYDAPEPPLLLLPPNLYEGGFPKAKSLVGAPLARFRGALDVDGRTIDVTDWVGSQNHNWGERHTDRYAWGQVAGFDDAPDAFLECASARVRVGPLLLPWMTVIVLRLGGREHRLNALWTAARASARIDDLRYHFQSARGGLELEGELSAEADAFVGLAYDDPAGGKKVCLNTKLARCELRVRVPGEPERHLRTAHRAAFELLGDTQHPSIPLVL